MYDIRKTICYLSLLSSLQVVTTGTTLTFAQQQDPIWDNTAKTAWPASFEQIMIPSSQDASQQGAYFYATTQKRPQPLVVSLHTWSGDYQQKDPLSKEILARDWNYIHPNFRGANRTPEAMGSDLVLSDIRDAIHYALQHGNVNPSEIHIIGVSGGAYATLLAYMQLDYPVKSFSAWAPISDIEAWYWESLGRKQKYAQDIEQALGGSFDAVEARKRSPLFQEVLKEQRKDAQLYIYEGIHDGYQGSVPITHAMEMYNRLVAEEKYGETALDSVAQLAKQDEDLVSEQEMIELLTKRMLPPEEINDKELFGRKVYVAKQHKGVHLTIFEGGHEQLPQALSYLPVKQQQDQRPYHILTIGDSNAAIQGGWVDQLRTCLPKANVLNISQSGRTIGFDNGGREQLNALKNVGHYLAKAAAESKGNAYDAIIVCLGTNDTKSEFADRQDDVLPHFEQLLQEIRSSKLATKHTRLIYVSPPPIREKDIDAKYVGGNQRLAQLLPQWEAKAKELGFEFVDVYHPLQGVSSYYAKDGVHMVGEGQAIIANKIMSVLNN